MQKVQGMFIVSLVFAIIITIFALTNANPVVINLLFYKFEASQALVIFISAALGAVIVASLGLVNQIKLKSQIKTLHKANEELSSKVNSLSTELKPAQIKIDETEAKDCDE
ncbi:LapA family protein [Clostridium sp.]|uniref:LapA family protein n=1 Tax=Clostridium sp. TaxID=1506 RepID=UPI002FC8E4CD